MDGLILAIVDVAKRLITVDAIIVLAIIAGLTEFLKQFCKSPSVTNRFKFVRQLSNWEIRALSIVLGLIMTPILMDNTLKMELVYGLFYGVSASWIVLIVKHYFVKKYMPNMNKAWSGQSEKDNNQNGG